MVWFILLFGFCFGWVIKPTSLELYSHSRSASITIVNDEEIPLSFQVMAAEWFQDEGGRDEYRETQDLIFYPKLFTLEPGEERIVRVSSRFLNPTKEKTYRLFVVQTPKAEEFKKGASVKVVVKFGVPIFVKPLKEELRYEIVRVAVEDGNFVLEIQNIGNIHIRINTIKLTGMDSQGQEVFSKEIDGWYILPSSKRVFRIKLQNCTRLSTLKFEVLGKGIRHEGNFKLVGEGCPP